jgi:hypothetical protein
MKIKLLLVILTMCVAAQAGVVGLFKVDVDTTAYAGQTGFLEFDLSSAGLPPAITENVWSIDIPDGSPNPAVPGPVLDNSSLFASQFVPVTFGTSLEVFFSVTPGPFTYPLANGTSFTMELVDAAQANYLLNPNGAVAEVDLAIDGSYTLAPFNSDVTLEQMPEPATFALAGTMLVGLGLLRKRAKRW